MSLREYEYKLGLFDLIFIISFLNGFSFRQPTSIAQECELRNRKSGAKVTQVSKQQVITLDNTDEILGAAATEKSLILVTSSKVMAIRISHYWFVL